MDSRQPTDAASEPDLFPPLQAVILHLYRAHGYAEAAGADAWEYAEELPALRSLGVSHGDLRWLIHKGYVVHAVEIGGADRRRRRFQIIRNLSMPENSCFVLTEKGMALARQHSGARRQPSRTRPGKKLNADAGPSLLGQKGDLIEKKTPTVILTGERLGDRLRIVIHGKQVGLTKTTFGALLSLIIARLETETGFVKLDRLAVSLLRRHCDEGIGPGAGKALIETGFQQEYRLSPSRDQLVIGVEPSFVEVESLRVISKKQFARLKSLLPQMASAAQ